MDDKQYLQSLIRKGEHQQQDFKYRVSDALKLAKSVSAFANTDGGRLLSGVRDDGNMSGVRDEEEIYMMHQAAYRYCRPEASINQDQELPINLIVRRSRIPRPKVISLLARLIRFNVVHWEYREQQFLFSL